MNPALLALSAKKVLSMAEINFNRAIGHQCIPVQDDLIGIETTSVCNLNCCFCAYGKKASPKITMKDDFFIDCITQAVELGYRRFILTPNTGDVFMDRHFLQRLRFLEEHPGVKEYTFYTNFTIPRPKDIERLTGLTKLRLPTISIYGHDRDTFVAIAKATDVVYKRLLTNLEILLGLMKAKRLPFEFNIALRSTRHLPGMQETDLLRLLDRFRQAGIDVRISRVYHDWGGRVTAEDTKGLDLDVADSALTYKKGACALLFTGVQIMATGVVHACSCVDVDAILKIGDLNEKPLREIVSTANPSYMALIEEQERGEFRSVCQACGFYKSIYHMRSMYRKDGIPIQSIDEFKARLDVKNAVKSEPLPLAAE